MVFGLPGTEIAMAHQIIIEISTNSSEFVEEDDVNSIDRSVIGSNPSESISSWATSVSGPPISSDFESVACCQCKKGTLAKCPICGHGCHVPGHPRHCLLDVWTHSKNPQTSARQHAVHHSTQ